MPPVWKGIVGKSFNAADFDRYVKSLIFTAWRPSFVVLHNTSSPTFAQWHSVPGKDRMQNLQHYYRDLMNWSAGPHLFIADDLIWTFTPLTMPGVHSPSWNAISWGVELVGNYMTEAMPAGLKANAASALASMHGVLGLDPSTLRLHREDPKTTHRDCPGNHVAKQDMISDVMAKLGETFPGEHPATTVDA